MEENVSCSKNYRKIYLTLDLPHMVVRISFFFFSISVTKIKRDKTDLSPSSSNWIIYLFQHMTRFKKNKASLKHFNQFFSMLATNDYLISYSNIIPTFHHSSLFRYILPYFLILLFGLPDKKIQFKLCFMIVKSLRCLKNIYEEQCSTWFLVQWSV